METSVILWLDGVRILDESFDSYSKAKEKADARQQHHMDAYGKKVSDFDRMYERRP
jgi:hypothetical protein